MGKKRGHNEGSVYPYRGKWRGQFTLADGKRTSKIDKDKKVVLAWLREMQALADQGMTYDSARTTFGELLDNWLERKKAKVRLATYQLYSHFVQAYIKPSIGDVKFKDLKMQRIQFFYDSLLESGVGTRSVQVIHTIVYGVCTQAVRLNLLTINPAAYVDKPHYEKKETEVWTEEQANAFMLAARGHRLEHLFYLALTTAMRLGELLGLKWEDVDLVEQFIHVRRQVFFPNGGGFQFQKPKTRKGNRPIKVDDIAVVRLRDQIERNEVLRKTARGRWREYGLVFPSSVGTPISRWNMTNEFQALIEKAGVPVIRFHDLRHTAITLMLNHGVDIYLASRRAGHSTIQITADRYGHLLPGAQDKVADLMGGIVNPIEFDLEVKDAEDILDDEGGSDLSGAGQADLGADGDGPEG